MSEAKGTRRCHGFNVTGHRAPGTRYATFAPRYGQITPLTSPPAGSAV